MIVRPRFLALVLVASAVLALLATHASATEDDRRLLVTVDNEAATRLASAYGQKPYRFRSRYRVAPQARMLTRRLAAEYGMEAVDEWPIDSLGVYCVVYRVAEGFKLEQILRGLRADERVTHAQPLQRFHTLTSASYDDPYVSLQHNIDELEVAAAHQLTRGNGVRVAIVDSSVDADHEDLRHAVADSRDFVDGGRSASVTEDHGTAVAGVIAARDNNAVGIVGVAPAVEIVVLRACWRPPQRETDICDSFTLAKALDALVGLDADIVNLSFGGPPDPLLSRLLAVAMEQGLIVVTAVPDDDEPGFPADVPGVITVRATETTAAPGDRVPRMSAPGHRILTAIPGDRYDFRSGASLAAAHVTGVMALLSSRQRGFGRADFARMLAKDTNSAAPVVANACELLAALAEPVLCEARPLASTMPRR